MHWSCNIKYLGNLQRIHSKRVKMSDFLAEFRVSYPLLEAKFLVNLNTTFGTLHMFTFLSTDFFSETAELHSFIQQWLYSPLLGRGLFFSFVIFCYTDGRSPWTSDEPVARPVCTHRTTQTQNKCTHRHPSLKWDSNPRPQRSSGRRQFMPQTARPLWSELLSLFHWNFGWSG
jgi:hypothetical protein